MRLPFVSRQRFADLAELVCAYNRIASEDLAEYKRRARKAEARVAELEQHGDGEVEADSLRRAIRTHRARNPRPTDLDLDLYANLGEDDR